MPLATGAPIYAVADGTILSVEAASDGDGGFDVKLLLQGNDGEGWLFLYEHVDLEPGLAVGSVVTKGRFIARNGLTTETRSNHLQLTYGFNNYEFYRDQRCWVDYLDTSGKTALLDYFSSSAVTDKLTAQWGTAVEEGMQAYIELLNNDRYPDGPQLCYPLGLDVRVAE